MKVLKVHRFPLEKLENKRSTKKLEDRLKKRLLLAIDDGLNQALGDIATKNVYWLLEQKCHLKPKEIPNNLERFQDILKEVFGTGALIIEKAIMENLYSQFSSTNEKISLKYKNKEHFNLINYINGLKNICRLNAALNS
jgi:hypothetical protein